ncbi:GNAT family N-acetyltransferase [Thalassotalea marina]|uniref:N-acetyltransferase domain-containing protein n=1 Tax=Thalassotalea marina TaxID=1673741 RepID=A0A919BNC8_9GAMM|nr:N-acetyltransferase [Thalassotalea marina]GHF99981.1 hypothetical protein GCM10017161_30710 [Thalassotalea marina]
MHNGELPLTLISASDSDQPYCWQLYQMAMKQHIESLWGWNYDWQRSNFVQQWKDTDCYLIFLNGQPCGYLQYSLIGYKLYVWMLILEENYRSQGIGAKVINRLPKNKSATHIQLRVFKSNQQAKKFYLEQQFIEIGQEKDFYLLERTL